MKKHVIAFENQTQILGLIYALSEDTNPDSAVLAGIISKNENNRVLMNWNERCMFRRFLAHGLAMDDFPELENNSRRVQEEMEYQELSIEELLLEYSERFELEDFDKIH